MGAVVQVTSSADSNDGSAASVSTAAFGSASGAGNVIVGHVEFVGTANTNLTTVTDGTNSYAIIDRGADLGYGFFVVTYCAFNISAGTFTLTGNFSPNTTFRRIQATEVSGVATSSQPHKNAINNSSSFGTGTDAVTSGSVTTTIDGCFIIGGAIDSSSATIPSVGTGYTSADSKTYAAGDAYRIEYKTQSTQGSVAATFTTTDPTARMGVWVMALAPPSGTVTPTAGALSLAGQAPTVISPVIVTPAAGTLALVGQEPQIPEHIITVGDVGALSYVGGEGLVGGLEPPQNTQPQPIVGTLFLNGQIPTVTATSGSNVTATPPAGALVLAGQAPTVLASLSAAPGAGTLTLAGQAPALLQDSIRAPAVGTLTLAGQAPTLLQDNIRSPGAGALVLAGQAPVLLQDSIRAPAAGALVLAGQAPTLLQDSIRAPAAGALVLAGQAPTLLQNLIVQPGAGALTLAGQSPAVLNGDARVAQPDAGALTLAGQAPTVLAAISVAPADGVLTLAGQAPTVLASQSAQPGAGALVLAGQAPTLSVTANVIANPLTGALIFTGLAPTVAVSDNRTVNPGAGALALAGQAPTIPIPSPTVTPDPGALALEGLAPGIVVSGDTLLSAKFIARRPNVRMKGLQPEPAQPAAPLPPEITNMPGTEAVVRKARGLDLGLITAPPALPASKPAVEVPPIGVTAPAGAPPVAEPPPVAPPPAAPAPKPAPVPPPAPATREDVRAELTQLHQQILESAKVRGEEMMMAIDSLTMRVEELQAKIEADIKARDLREKNMLRAKQITERMLRDLEK